MIKIKDGSGDFSNNQKTSCIWIAYTSARNNEDLGNIHGLKDAAQNLFRNSTNLYDIQQTHQHSYVFDI